MEEKRQELLERRRQEDEERKQKNRELIEAREKRIAEERRKREAAIEKLKQKPAHDLLVTTNFFKQLDEEENVRKNEEEWRQYVKEMEEAQRTEEEKEKAAQDLLDKRQSEKARKQEERQASVEQAAAEKLIQKAQRKEEYERNTIQDKIQKKKEWEERQAKLLAAFLERQQRREAKVKKGALPKVEPIDYDDRKIFIGGIKLDDIKNAKLDPKLAAKIRDERFNSVLRMFDQFGEILKRKVSLEEGHCFVTFKEPGSVEKAMATMKEADERKKLVEEAKTTLQERKQHPLCVPNANFYVRIPKGNAKKDKQKAKRAQKQKDKPVQAPPSPGGEWEVVGSDAQPPAQPASPNPAISTLPGKPKRVINSMVVEWAGGKIGDEEVLQKFTKTTPQKKKFDPKGKMKATSRSPVVIVPQWSSDAPLEPIATSDTDFLYFR